MSADDCLLIDEMDYVQDYGYGGGSFLFKLAPLEPPRNDMFANRQLLSRIYSYAEAYNFGATKEPGEPGHGWNTGGHSVWWEWSSSAVTNITVEAYGDGFPVLLGV